MWFSLVTRYAVGQLTGFSAVLDYEPTDAREVQDLDRTTGTRRGGSPMERSSHKHDGSYSRVSQPLMP